MMPKIWCVFASLIGLGLFFRVGIVKSEQVDNFRKYEAIHNGYVIESVTGQRIQIRPYGDYMVRLQFSGAGESFFPDNHYEMIARHGLGGSLSMNEYDTLLVIETKPADGIRIEISKTPLRFAYFRKGVFEVLLADDDGVIWDETDISAYFQSDSSEHFLGVGQKPFGYQEQLDLKGQHTRRNYGEYGIPGRGAQGNLLVPFFMSSKGYGLFFNNSFPNDFSFNHKGKYAVTFETMGFKSQMDLVFILGPGFDQMLERYTRLTGRPRMLPKSMFGLQLSDNDPRLNGKPIDHHWREIMVTHHRNAGFPLDHLVFDNDWRAGSGGWSGSWFEFDSIKYPDPSAFKSFLEKNGLTLTLDLNMNNCNDSWGWQPEYNMPIMKGCSDLNSNSYPDYTSQQTRNWLWELFWNKALNPELNYPGDGLWIDEPDGIWPDCVTDTVILSNGRSWTEMKNYYYFLITKAVAQEGWINENGNNGHYFGESKRPYIWIRGGTAGGQRYGTHWTGDIHFTQRALKGQIISMQASGLSGFPFFNHDAGGFVEEKPGPSDSVYIQWAMALGSFSPIWRPHGYGQPRWPLNRSQASQYAAMKYGRLRYELMPYIYTTAHVANQTGMPMARSMSMIYPDKKEAWQHELQYLWGDFMLVAPGLNLMGQDSLQNVWLPEGNDWYFFWNDRKIAGGQIIQHNAVYGELPVFVKSGAIIPCREFAQSTFWLSDKHLILDVYAGNDGEFILQEDDGVTERYLTRHEIRRTRIHFTDSADGSRLVIEPATGSYQNASLQRDYLIRFHGLKKPDLVALNGKSMKINPNLNPKSGITWDKELLLIQTEVLSVEERIDVQIHYKSK